MVQKTMMLNSINMPPNSTNGSCFSRQKNVFFGAGKITALKLKELQSDKSEAFVSAVFSRLDPNDDGDVQLITKLLAHWEKKCKFIEKMVRLFFKKDNDFAFYILEKEGQEPLEKRVKSFMVLDNPDIARWSDKLTLWYLQAAPEIANNKKSSIRGSGENMIYCAARILSDLKHRYSGLQIPSENNKFYEHLGLMKSYFEPIPEQDTYELTSDMSEAFLRRIEDKYHFSGKLSSKRKQVSEVTRLYNFRNFDNNFFC